jgi:peptide/nickel transport system ATP-binding protein
MYAGRIVEHGPVEQILQQPLHPYTRGLIGSLPGAAGHGRRLRQIPGTTPSAARMPKGCPFRPRCYAASEVCVELPPEVRHNDTLLRCFHPQPGALQ